MIDILGFWSTVTFFIALPVWFFGYRITRGILSIAKSNAPELPRELRKGRCFRWDYHLYPQWAHKLNRMFGGGFVDTGGVAILGILSFVPVVTMLTGAFNPQHTVIGLIADVAQFGSTIMGWIVVVVSILITGYIAINKGSRLVGLIQIQEMKDKMK